MKLESKQYWITGILPGFWICFFIQGCASDHVIPAKVTTTVVTGIESAGALSGGTVVSQGSSTITRRGVCWGKVPGPTIEQDTTQDGAGPGQFLSVLSRLSPSTTYYVRAYAITGIGVIYGNEVSFTTTVAVVVLEATHDTSIFNNLAGDSPEKDYGAGGSQLLRVGYSASEDAYGRTLIQFDLTSLPPDASIDSISLQFTTGKSGTNVQKIYVHKLLESWTEGTTTEGCNYYGSCQPMGTALAVDATDATWMKSSYTGTTWASPGGTFVAAPSATSTDTFANPNVFTSTGLKEDAQQWIQHPETNFGWILKIDEPMVTTSGALKRYVSREFVSDPLYPAHRPHLVILYH